jgi:hypothetical protein
MAITIQYQPDEFSPAYNRNEYKLTSTNSSETGFNYIVDIYPAGSGTKIAEYRVKPQLLGQGYVDIRKILSTLVSHDFDPSVTLFKSNNNQTWKQYDIKFGEEFNVDYNYTGFNDDAGYVRLIGVDPHSFVAGDQIELTESVAGTNPLLTGLHSIISVTVNTLTIDVVYADMISPTTIAGFVNYADNRKTIFRDLTTVLGQTIFNGAIEWKDFNSYDSSNYNLDSITDLFLTSLKAGKANTFNMTPDAEMYINVWNQKEPGTEYMYFVNSNGDELYKQVTNTSDEVTIIPAGAANNGATFANVGLPPLVKSDTTFYKFYYTDSLFNRISQEYYVDIDRRCQIETFQILFLDRLGSWLPFAFNLKAQENVTVKRTIINQRVQGFDDGSKWSYDSYENGLIAINTEIDKELTLNTNWMTQSDNEIFQYLVTSPKTFIKLEDGKWYSCIVKTNSEEVVRQRGKTLIQKTVKVELANKDIING